MKIDIYDWGMGLCIVGLIILIPEALDDPCKCETCIMYDENTTMGLRGIYYPSEDYYCVWMEDRTVSQVKSTEEHEVCHALVHNDTEHFCGWAIETSYLDSP